MKSPRGQTKLCRHIESRWHILYLLSITGQSKSLRETQNNDRKRNLYLNGKNIIRSGNKRVWVCNSIIGKEEYLQQQEILHSKLRWLNIFDWTKEQTFWSVIITWYKHTIKILTWRRKQRTVCHSVFLIFILTMAFYLLLRYSRKQKFQGGDFNIITKIDE